MRYRQEPVLPTPERVPMKKLATLIVSALLLATPAHAIVGGGTPQTDGVARAVVTIVGSRGNFCTGSLIAPKLVLTVAHCVQPGADYKIVDRGADGQPQLLNVRTVAIHPSFNMQAMQAHRATADVALLQLEIPLKGKSIVPVGMPNIPIQVGSRFTIAGIGVTVRGDGKSWRHDSRCQSRCHWPARHVPDPPGRSRNQRCSRRNRRLHRRFRWPRVRGQAQRRRACRRHQLVDRAE